MAVGKDSWEWRCFDMHCWEVWAFHMNARTGLVGERGSLGSLAPPKAQEVSFGLGSPVIRSASAFLIVLDRRSLMGLAVRGAGRG